MIKPIAVSMFNIKGKDSDKYFKEVEGKLIEETNYILEVEQSKEIALKCAHIPNLSFPSYYEELSSERIITMDYMAGEHLSEFTAYNTNQEYSDKLGQALWDFYMFQMHTLKKVHADPHPGNFLVSKDAGLIALDFGCMKIIPDEFYIPYFELADVTKINDRKYFVETLYQLEILREDDTPKEIAFFTDMFYEMLSLFTQPLQADVFDFSDGTFFGKITELGERYSKSTELRKMNANRGSTHFIYINRTFFGLYNLMFDLKARNIKINNYKTL
jgi:predicted unusual protein kinase regulating ubiquinone biosynthesis (AarF/ABC1/UbiB family)